MSEEIRGMGDQIARITRMTRIDTLAKKLANIFGKEDCGCEQRREILNQLFPSDKHIFIVDSREKSSEDQNK